jgi:hypothetical protein
MILDPVNVTKGPFLETDVGAGDYGRGAHPVRDQSDPRHAVAAAHGRGSLAAPQEANALDS